MLGWGVAMVVFRDSTAFRLYNQHLLDSSHSVGYDSPESGLKNTQPTKPTKVWNFE